MTLILRQNIGKSFKVAQNSFQHLYWKGRYNHSLALDATIMVSKNFSIIGEHFAIIFFDTISYHSNSMTS